MPSEQAILPRPIVVRVGTPPSGYNTEILDAETREPIGGVRAMTLFFEVGEWADAVLECIDLLPTASTPPKAYFTSARVVAIEVEP